MPVSRLAPPPTPRLDRVHCPGAASQRGDGHDMAYWEWGDPDNPQVVLCLHGLTRQGRDFDVLAAALAPHFRVLCPDVVGRGQSDWLSDPMAYQLPQYVADMQHLLAHLGLSTVHWVGTSMGGLVGMALASQASGPVSRLVLNDVGPVLERSALRRIAEFVGRSPRWGRFDEACEALRSVSVGFGPHSPEQWQALCRHMVKAQGDGWQVHYDPGIAEAFRAAYGPQGLPEPALQQAEAVLWQLFDAITCPTLLIRGEQSDLLCAQTAQAMQARGPRVALLEVPDTGHAPTLVAEPQVQAVLRFLGVA
jgi:pimeloyl-ACP methyl ester carboxylesterase